MVIRLTLICHATTFAVREAAFPTDEPLDTQDSEKLATMTHRLSRPDRCWTSPAQRAIQTAEALQLNAIVEPMLRECDYGRWSGHSFNEVQAKEPEAMALWMRDPEAIPHGGESIADLITRVAAWLETQNGMPGLTIVVTHASVIRAAIVRAIEAGPRSFWRIDVSPLSLTRLIGHGGHWTVASVGLKKADSWLE